MESYRTFMKRAQSWKNIFNPKTGYIEPRHDNGAFYADVNPASDKYYVEGNATQYSWMVSLQPALPFRHDGRQ